MMLLYIILIIIAAAAIWGYIQGFVQQIGSVAGIIVAIIVCRVFGSEAAAFTCSDLAPGSDATFVTILTYIALGLVAYLGTWLLARMLRGLIRGLHLGIIDKIAGAVYKVLLWLIVVSLVYNLYLCVVPGNAPASSSSEDVWKQRVLKFAPEIFGSQSARDILDTMSHTISDR